MLKKYLKLAVKHLIKNKGFSLINLFGLAISLAATIFILLYIESEYSYDKHWKDSNLIYRISESINMQGKVENYALSSFRVADDLKAKFPEIKEAGRLMYWLRQANLTREEIQVEVKNIYYADSCFTKLFNLPFIEGNPKSALTAPNCIIISEELARTFFGHTQVLGQELKMDKKSFTITGVFKDPGKETHIPLNALISASTYPQTTRDQMSNDWLWQVCYTYLKFNREEDVENFKSKMQKWEDSVVQPFVQKNELNLDIDFKLMPVRDIHLYSEFSYDMPTNSTQKYIYILGCVGIFILLISCINYMNLATSKASLRSLEVGIRKSMGAQRTQLIGQFLTESGFITVLALFLAIIMVWAFLPAFNRFSEKEFDFFTHIIHYKQFHIWGILLGVGLITSTLSGSFPAFILSAFSPMLAIKGGNTHAEKSITVRLRKILIVLQLTISIGMIIATLIIHKQMDYMKNKKLGFNGEQVLVIKFPKDKDLQSQAESIKQQMLKIPGITSTSIVNNLPGYPSGSLLFYFTREGVQEQQMINLYRVDEDYLKTLDIPLVKGHFFLKESQADKKNGLIINETCAKFLGLEDPLGKKLTSGYTPEGEVIGVVKDFNYKSLHNPLEPLIMIYGTDRVAYMAIKFQPKECGEVVKKVINHWKTIAPNHPLHYDFLDSTFSQLYKKEEKLFQIFSLFSGLIILIASMGLLGITSFMVERKKKEIAIRKVLGADNIHLLKLLSKDFIIWLLIANSLAWPLCFYLMTKWLENFEYHIIPGWSSFFMASIFTFSITVITILKIGHCALREAPATQLRSE